MNEPMLCSPKSNSTDGSATPVISISTLHSSFDSRTYGNSLLHVCRFSDSIRNTPHFQPFRCWQYDARIPCIYMRRKYISKEGLKINMSQTLFLLRSNRLVQICIKPSRLWTETSRSRTSWAPLLLVSEFGNSRYQSGSQPIRYLVWQEIHQW